jgi:hypothetical protein
MPSFNSPRQSNRGISWAGIIGTLLLALLFAVDWYLEWSSETNLAEFIDATRPPVSDPNYSGADPLYHGPYFPLF